MRALARRPSVPLPGRVHDPYADVESFIMPLGDHLEELRTRLIHALLGIAPIMIGAFIVGRWVLERLIGPVQDALARAGLPPALQATGPMETFASYMRVSFVITFIISAPWVIWQVWKFVAPGLLRREKRFVRMLVPMSAVQSLVGVAFMYFVILPVVLSFFIGFGSNIGFRAAHHAPLPEGVVLPTDPVLEADPESPPVGARWINLPLMQQRICVGYDPNGMALIVASELTRGAGIVQQYRVSEYVKMLLGLAMAFAVGFQTPVIVLLLGWAGLVDRAWLAKYRRHAIMTCVVAAAVLTPTPDPFTLTLLGVPLYLLYELGVLLLILFPASKVRGEPNDDGMLEGEAVVREDDDAARHDSGTSDVGDTVGVPVDVDPEDVDPRETDPRETDSRDTGPRDGGAP
jgi:sec-independent protein translocase protein TatC